MFRRPPPLKTTRQTPHRKRTILTRSIARVIAVAAGFGPGTAGQAATIYWDGTGPLWGTNTFWSTVVGATTPDPAAAPGAADVANFSISTVNTAQTVNLGAAQSALGLVFLGTNTATTTVQGGGTNQTLTLGASGIAVNAGAGAVTIGSATAGQNVAIALGAGQTWLNNASATLTIINGVTNGANFVTIDGTGATTIAGIMGGGAGGLTKNGAGTLTLSGANTYTGFTTISVGAVNMQNASALGTVATATSVASGAALQIQGGITTLAEALTLNGTGISTTGALRNISGGNNYVGLITLGSATRINSDSGTLTLSNAGTISGATFGLTVGGAGATAINSIIGTTTGGVTVDATATGGLTLSGVNTYTGTTSILGGTLTLNVAAPNGATGALGNATSAVLLGNTTGAVDASLLTSAAVTIARAVTVQAGNAGSITIGGSGASASVFSGAITLNKVANFTAAAGGTSTFSGVVSGMGGLTKTGAGTVVLSGTNTFTGAVVVNGSASTVSTLQVSTNAGALGTNASVTLNAGTLAAGQGTTLDLRSGLTWGTGKTLTMNSAPGDLRSTLLNGAGNNTWAGNIVAAGVGLTQINAASGATLTITGGITSSGGAGTGTLFVRGAGTVALNGVVNLGVDRIFSHTDAGTVIVNSTGNSWLRTQAANGQIQIGATNALPNVEFTFGQNATGDGRIELNGFNQQATRLNSFSTSSGTHTLRNSNLTTASTLTFATPVATTDTLTNVDVFGTAAGMGTLNLVSNGIGRSEFNNGLVAANSWTVNSGTLAFTGNNSRLLPGALTGLAGATIEKAGTGSLSVRGVWNNAGTTNVVGGLLAFSNGTVGGINVSDGAGLGAGLNGGVLTASSVAFGSAGGTTFAPILGTPSIIAPLQPATLTTSGTTVTVAPQAPSFAIGTYALIDYGTISGNGFGGFALGPVGTYPHLTANLEDNTLDGRVDLKVTAVDSLIWTGNASGVWDVNTTQNFALASSSTTPAIFYTGDVVVFGDTSDLPAPATAVTNRTITGGAINIGNLTFNNSAGNDYSVANPLSGAGGITKNNTGTLTLSGANSYFGPTILSSGTLLLSGANNLNGTVTVTGGTLKIANGDALRNAPAVTVSGGGTFDANGTAVGNRYAELIVSGAGVGGNGAIVNNGAAITNNSHFTKITLAGDTTWGGSGRYDLVAGQIFDGGSFTLTKVGAGELWYNPSAGSTLEKVIVNGGFFGSQQANPLSTTATVTVNNGGTHQIFSNVAQQHKVVLQDGGILRSTSSTPTLNGSVSLDGTTAGRFIQGTSGTTLNIAGKITGTGGFTINDVGTVSLQNAANDYLGDTVINAAGTLHIAATGSIPATTDLIINAGTFGTGGAARAVASLSGTGGTLSGGSTFTSNQAMSTTWSGVLSSTTLAMNGSGTLTLAGTVDNSSGVVVANNGTVVFAKTGDYAVHAVGSGNLGLTINNGATVQIGGALTAVTGGSASNNPPADVTPATPPANYVDQLFNFTDVQLNTGGTLDLNGRIEAIDGLAGGGTVTNTSATTARLYVGYNNTISTSPGFLGNTSAFSGVIQNGTGLTEFSKIGTGTLVLDGANTYTGATAINGGTLAVAASGSLGNTSIAINTGGTFAPSGNVGATGSITLKTGGTLNVGGNNAGGTANTISVGSLSLAGGTVNLDVTGTAADRINTSVSNGLSMSGTNSVNALLGPGGWVTGTYPVYTYAGTLQGTGTAALSLITPTGHATVAFTDNNAGSVNMIVDLAGNTVWVGGAGNAWDINNTLNWASADNKFLNGDNVLFDNTAITFTPSIAASVTPAVVRFDNNNANPYTLSGAAGIAGPGQLTKDGPGTVTLLNPNTYAGRTNVLNGTLIANYNAGVGVTVLSTASTVDIANGATFKAISNDADFTFGNNITGTGSFTIDPHATADAAARNITMNGSLAGFTGTLNLTPAVFSAFGFRLAVDNVNDIGGASTINIGAGGQAFISAANLTFPGNFNISGTGYVEAAGRLGAIRASGANTTFAGIITVNGTAKIGALGGSANITNTLTGGTLTFGGSINNAGSETMNITGNASGLAGLIINDATGTSNGATILVNLGNGTATGTLGAVPVTLRGDGFKTAILRVDRTDGYALGAGVTSSSPTAANNVRTQLQVDTLGMGFSTNGKAIDLGGTSTGGAFRIGNTRMGAIATVNSALTAGSVNVAVGATGAVLNIAAGAVVNTGDFFIGEQAAFSGAVNQTNGAVSVARQVRIGHWPNATSTYGISAGTFVTTANPGLATNPSNIAESNGGIYVGIDGTGIMNQSGGTVTTDWVVLDNRSETLAGANQPDGIDRYNLSGGNLEIRGTFGITNRNASTEFAFTGGTIKNVGTGVNAAISGLGNFVIGNGGIGTPTIDTNGATNAFTISRAFSGAGALAKVGAGALNLNVASPGWMGNLSVAGGTVATGASNGGLGSFTTAGRTISASIGSTISMSGNNVFGNGIGNPNLPSILLDASTLNSTRYNAIGDIVLHNGASLIQAATDGPGAYEGYQFRGSVTVGGTGASNITTTNSRGNHLGANTLFSVVNTTANLVVSAPLRDQSADFGGTGGLTKAGPGTMLLGGANTFTGATNVSAGTLLLDSATPNTAIPTDGVAGNTDITISGGTLQIAASEQIGNNGGILLNSGSFNFNGSGLTETIGSLTNNGGTFVTGANSLIGTGNTVTWNSGTNTISDGGSVEDQHVAINGGTNTVEGGATGGVLQVNGGGTGLEMTGGTLTLNSDAAIPGRLLLQGAVSTFASALTSNINSGLALAGKGTVDLDGSARTFTVADGAAATDLAISAAMTNGGLTKAGPGTLSLTGANPYTGDTTINGGILEATAPGALGGTGNLTINSSGTLLLGGADRIHDAAPVTLAGGTLNTGGFSETVGTLTLMGDSIIDFGNGGSLLRFADSQSATWTGTLSLWNWSGNTFTGGGIDQLYFGNGPGVGLTATQLAQINFFSGPGTGQLSITGAFSKNRFVGSLGEVVPVPEPSSVALAMGLLGLIGWRERRKTRQTRTAERRATQA